MNSRFSCLILIMDPSKLSFLLTLLVGVGLVQSQLTTTDTADCSNRCTLQFRCIPYYKDLVWSIVNGMCRVFQNGCIFDSENCRRENQCLKPMVAINSEQCRCRCRAIRCSREGPQVCAWFPYVDANGNNAERQSTFPNRCQLDVYACLKSEAYVGDPTLGPCQS